MEASTLAYGLSTTTLAPVVQTAATTAITPSHTFIKLCLLWTALHRNSHFPEGCKGVLTDKNVKRFQSSDDLSSIISGFYQNGSRVHKVLPRGQSEGNGVSGPPNDNHVGFHYKYTTRSLSVIGVLGGIVLILLVVALSTCIRNRRGLLMEPYSSSSGHESFARQILIDHIRHISQSRRERHLQNDTPPAYEDVVKETEEEDDDEAKASEEEEGEEEVQPPTYVEAMERSSIRLEELDSSDNSTSHVVQIEVSYPPDQIQHRHIQVQN